MKKIRIVIILVFSALILACCVRFCSKGHSTNYKLGDNNEYKVKETYTRNNKSELDNYYIEISVDKNNFSFQLFKNFEKKRKIVEDIIYYDGEYKCMLPIINEVAQTDILCYRNNRYYDYATIIGKDEKLDKFVDSIDINVYDKNNYLDKSTETISEDGINLYTYNVNKEHYIALSNLKGIYLVNNSIKDIEIFNNDIYTRNLSAVVNNYYITADYSSKQQFRIFYFIELTSGKIQEAKAPNYISFDSYIQGIVDDKLYIYDKDNKKQYEINVENLEIEEVGNSKKKIKYYENGEWSKITVTKANNEMLFDYTIEDADLDKFDYVYLKGGKNDGYYYMYDKIGNLYNVYRAPQQNKKSIKYLFKVEKIEDIFYLDEYIYYKSGNKLKYYSDYTGSRTILEYNEIEFNENLVFGVYKGK